MGVFKKAFCRAFQFAFHAALPVLPYREPKILDSTDEIAEEIIRLSHDSVLLVTDDFLYGSGAASELEKSLEAKGIRCSVYSKVRPNPTADNAEEAFSVFKKEKCGCIIAFGGGSSLDCAKALGARAAYPKKSLEKLKGTLKIFRKLPPLFAVPTTAGTGSEVTLTAVVTDTEKKHKYTMNSFPLIPRYAVLDPKVTYSLPPHLTATTGMDALTHAVEAYIGRSTSRETRRLAKEAVKLIFDNIETAYKEGSNEAARRNMLIAAYKAGIAFSKSYVGYVHAVAHSLGGQYNVPHGFANSVLLPIVLEDYGKVIHKKLYELALAAGTAQKSDSYEVGARKFTEQIKAMNKRLEIPETISGIDEKDIPKMASYAAKEGNPLYPVPKLMDAKELEKFYYKVADWS